MNMLENVAGYAAGFITTHIAANIGVRVARALPACISMESDTAFKVHVAARMIIPHQILAFAGFMEEISPFWKAFRYGSLTNSVLSAHIAGANMKLLQSERLDLDQNRQYHAAAFKQIFADKSMLVTVLFSNIVEGLPVARDVVPIYLGYVAGKTHGDEVLSQFPQAISE
jgi:hypothetical protein